MAEVLVHDPAQYAAHAGRRGGIVGRGGAFAARLDELLCLLFGQQHAAHGFHGLEAVHLEIVAQAAARLHSCGVDEHKLAHRRARSHHQPHATTERVADEHGTADAGAAGKFLDQLCVALHTPALGGLVALSEAGEVDVVHLVALCGHALDARHGVDITAPAVHEYERLPCPADAVVQLYAVYVDELVHNQCKDTQCAAIRQIRNAASAPRTAYCRRRASICGRRCGSTVRS